MYDDPRLGIEKAVADAVIDSALPAVSQQETSVDLPSGGESNDPASVSQRLSRDLPPTVNIHYDDDDYLAMMESELRRLDGHGVLDGLSEITDDPGKFDTDLKQRASGLYHPARRDLYVAPEEIIGEAPRERQAKAGYYSTDKNFGSVWHELGHHRIRTENPDESFVADSDEEFWGADVMAEFAGERGWGLKEIRQKIADEVSEYATTGGMEFIAEVYAGLMAGNDYPEWVMELHGRLDGPVPPEAARNPETAYEPMVAPAPDVGAVAAAANAAAEEGQVVDDDRDFGEILEDAAVYDDESVDDVLDEFGATHVTEYDGEDYYAIHEEQVWVAIVGDDYAYAEPFEEWIYDSWTWGSGLSDFLDNSVEDGFVDDFWRTGGTAYHVTEVDSASRIIVSGEIQRRDKTRGIGNKSVGSAVFVSRQSPQTVYGDVVFEVDTDAMKEDGFKPEVTMEPEILEARQREAIASMFVFDNFWAEYPHDVSQDTVIVYDDIPLRYLSVSADPGILDDVKDKIREHAEGDAKEDALSWIESNSSDEMSVSTAVADDIAGAIGSAVAQGGDVPEKLVAALGQFDPDSLDIIGTAGRGPPWTQWEDKFDKTAGVSGLYFPEHDTIVVDNRMSAHHNTQWHTIRDRDLLGEGVPSPVMPFTADIVGFEDGEWRVETTRSHGGLTQALMKRGDDSEVRTIATPGNVEPEWVWAVAYAVRRAGIPESGEMRYGFRQPGVSADPGYAPMHDTPLSEMYREMQFEGKLPEPAVERGDAGIDAAVFNATEAAVVTAQAPPGVDRHIRRLRRIVDVTNVTEIGNDISVAFNAPGADPDEIDSGIEFDQDGNVVDATIRLPGLQEASQATRGITNRFPELVRGLDLPRHDRLNDIGIANPTDFGEVGRDEAVIRLRINDLRGSNRLRPHVTLKSGPFADFDANEVMDFLAGLVGEYEAEFAPYAPRDDIEFQSGAEPRVENESLTDVPQNVSHLADTLDQMFDGDVKLSDKEFAGGYIVYALDFDSSGGGSFKSSMMVHAEEGVTQMLLRAYPVPADWWEEGGFVTGDVDEKAEFEARVEEYLFSQDPPGDASAWDVKARGHHNDGPVPHIWYEPDVDEERIPVDEIRSFLRRFFGGYFEEFPTAIRESDDESRGGFQFQAVDDLPPGRARGAADTVVAHAEGWADDISVEGIAGTAIVEFQPRGFPSPSPDWADNPTSIVIHEDGTLADAMFRYGHLPGTEWQPPEADKPGDEILADLDVPDGVEVEYDLGDFDEYARPHLHVAGHRFADVSGDVDWAEVMEFGREFGDRLRGKYLDGAETMAFGRESDDARVVDRFEAGGRQFRVERTVQKENVIPEPNAYGFLADRGFLNERADRIRLDVIQEFEGPFGNPKEQHAADKKYYLPAAGDSAWSQITHVPPKLQREGIASRLMDLMLEDMAGRGYTTVYAQGTTDAGTALLESFGFGRVEDLPESGSFYRLHIGAEAQAGVDTIKGDINELTMRRHSYRGFSPGEFHDIMDRIEDETSGQERVDLESEVRSALGFIEGGRFNPLLEAVSDFFYKLDHDEQELFTERNPDMVQWMSVWNRANGYDPYWDFYEMAADILTGEMVDNRQGVPERVYDRVPPEDYQPPLFPNNGQPDLTEMLNRRRSYRGWSPFEINELIGPMDDEGRSKSIELTQGQILSLGFQDSFRDFDPIEDMDAGDTREVPSRLVGVTMLERVEDGRLDDLLDEMWTQFMALDPDESKAIGRRNPGLLTWAGVWARSRGMAWDLDQMWHLSSGISWPLLGQEGGVEAQSPTPPPTVDIDVVESSLESIPTIDRVERTEFPSEGTITFDFYISGMERPSSISYDQFSERIEVMILRFPPLEPELVRDRREETERRFFSVFRESNRGLHAINEEGLDILIAGPRGHTPHIEAVRGVNSDTVFEFIETAIDAYHDEFGGELQSGDVEAQAPHRRIERVSDALKQAAVEGWVDREWKVDGFTDDLGDRITLGVHLFPDEGNINPTDIHFDSGTGNIIDAIVRYPRLPGDAVTLDSQEHRERNGRLRDAVASVPTPDGVFIDEILAAGHVGRTPHVQFHENERVPPRDLAEWVAGIHAAIDDEFDAGDWDEPPYWEMNYSDPEDRQQVLEWLKEYEDDARFKRAAFDLVSLSADEYDPDNDPGPELMGTLTEGWSPGADHDEWSFKPGQPLEYWEGLTSGAARQQMIFLKKYVVDGDEFPFIHDVDAQSLDTAPVPPGGFEEGVAFVEATPEEFAGYIEDMIEADPEMGAFLTYHPPNELTKHTLLATPDGGAGVAISPDGDIQNLYNVDGPSGAGREALKEAIRRGGCTLDAYDGFLRDLYAQYGFRETGRMKFNPEYAPDGWNLDRFGHPDVVFMAYQPEVLIAAEADNYYEPDEWGQAKVDAREQADCEREGGLPKQLSAAPPDVEVMVERTDREREILESVAARKGQEWVDEHEEMILAQARCVGEL